MPSPIPPFVVEAIAHDATFFLDATKAIVGHPDVSLISLPFNPWVSLFVVESYARFCEFVPEIRQLLPPEHIKQLEPARHRTKLLLGGKSDVATYVRSFSGLVEEERSHYASLHKGKWSAFKRLIQPDLGVSVCNGRVFSTTHATRFILGGQAPNSADISRTGALLGGYCAFVGRIVSKVVPGLPFPRPSTLKIAMRDIKSPALYRRGPLGRLPIEWSAVLTMVLVSTNYVHRVLRTFVPEEATTYRKIRTLQAFNAIHSIRLVQDCLVTQKLLNDKSASILRTILRDPRSRWLRDRGDLRDLFVHYKPHPIRTTWNSMRYEQVTSALCGTRDVEQLSSDVDGLLALIADTLEAGFELKPDTFWYGEVT